MNTPKDEQLLIEAVTTAWRPRRRGEIDFHPNWYDLDETAREQAFDATHQLRAMESAIDPEGLSTTARSVLARIESAGG